MTLAFKRGEKDAYQAIHDAYASKVYGICRRMLLNREDAEEAAQETFLKVYQALGRFNGRYQLGAWISRIATNVCLDHLRCRARKPVTTEAAVELLELDPDHFEDKDPEEIVIRNSESRHVRRVLGKLPPMHRAAIVLRDFEGLAYDEIATALEITDCQVKALIHRARQNFKRSWAREMASALVPAGMVDRLRKLSLFGRDSAGGTSTRVVEVAGPSMPTVASCASVAQQCGQAFAERVAPLAMAFLVGGTTVGAGAVAAEQSDPPSPVRAEAEDDVVPVSAPARAVTEPDPLPPARGAAAEEESETAAHDPAAPPSEDEPGDTGGRHATDPGPSPEPTPSPITGTAPVPQNPEPGGFSFSFASDVPFSGLTCDCLGDTTLVRETSTTDKDTGVVDFSQLVTGTATGAGTRSYGVTLQHAYEPGPEYSAIFSLRTREGEYRYRARAAQVARERTSWGGWSYVYEGDYELTSRPSTGEQVPEGGGYRVSVAVSTTQARIVSLHVALTESG